MNTFDIRGLRPLAIVCAGLLLAACGSHSTVDAQGHSAEPKFPAISDSYRPQGSYVNLENLGKIQPGMGKAQLYELLGTPHFQEGLFGVHEWDYVLRFRRPGQQDLVCQYKVLFDKDMQAQTFLISPADCLDQARPVPAASPVVAPAAAQRVTLGGDATFAFDSAELSAAGRASLAPLAGQLKAQQPAHISITGHTDRLGSPAYNLDLSRRRAETVRDYLAAAGVPTAAMRVRGAGAAEPLADCPELPRSQLIHCLAADRRVVIESSAVAAQAQE
ncbi:outer membrane protein OmpA-like peptidoglycan-associated protein [Pseudomonas nitritireducens]|uniref:Outer membrane protein OmpA-like peptidoglycan-associated protein n=1 Tax=Pseudomonas nitroreducens TaxID=46680 RepID=A0A7W7KJT3_PSENT|nr:OmpA family protein [Pseudomonas nitritireducens]MBB4864101.1 outer membrane protein OmpA-like peptidoglycan-associated protein [Pseudomonas nitritireducens]